MIKQDGDFNGLKRIYFRVFLVQRKKKPCLFSDHCFPCLGITKKTEVIHEELNPVWNEVRIGNLRK